MVIIITFLEELTQKLRANRKKRWAQSRKQFSEIGDVIKKGTDPDKNKIHPDSINTGLNSSVENSTGEEIAEPTLGERIHDRRQKIRQKADKRNEKMREKSEVRIAERYSKHEDYKKRFAAIDPGKKKVAELIFMGVTAAIAMLFIGFNIWPASFFNSLEFQKGFSRTDLFVFLETCITLFLFASPILMYTFRRMAKKVVLKEPEEFNHDPAENFNSIEAEYDPEKGEESENK